MSRPRGYPNSAYKHTPPASLILVPTSFTISGTTVVTDEDGNLVEAKDYYPYGETRVGQEGTSGHKPDYGFTGKEEDTESGLHYFGARFYDATIGRFTSQDPAALFTPERFLHDPQQLNMYSYARNNPMLFIDQKGEAVDIFVDAGFIIYDLYKVGKALITGGDVKSEFANSRLDNFPPPFLINKLK